ncbi:MAG: TIGR04190 family B12-binding domain/radical SAM domain protein [Coriobacteriia bacterium]|nr:TIGR04190 family B12-binding domain/radical SAM domain protein [Coriobacteriia bacterium]
MPKVDVILFHAPAVYDFRERSIMFGPVSDVVPSTPVFEMYPIGLTTIAEYLERHGITVRIVNLAGLMLGNPRFDAEKYISRLEARVFGVDLHWLPHAQGSVEVARIVKRLHPDVPLVFGGLSATYFHEELIGYDAVDLVMRGDSTEEPMLRLVEAIKRGGSLGDIPNLTWKDRSGAVTVNPLSWVPADMDAVALDYSYPMKAVIRHRDMFGFVPFKSWLTYPVCASLICRGCTHDCVTCGGSSYSFKKHFGRDRVAFRDPDLLVRDIEHVQRYIAGPMFVLNDFLQAGHEYTHDFVRGLSSINLKNPIGFEFFRPPSEEFYGLLEANLPDWSVEISVESHDDDVRSAFGKGHYTMEQVEQTVKSALAHGCSRFDLYFMTGIPTQTAASVRETAEYVRHLYESVGYDKRLLCFISPMAPFLDPGSRVFDSPDTFGYKLRARTLEEHRERLTLPSWKYIMNYESDAMTPDELVDSTYDAALVINRIKGEAGIVDEATMRMTEDRIGKAKTAMARIDGIMAKAGSARDSEFAAFKDEFERLSQSTICEKTELNWPRHVGLRHVVALGGFFIKENIANLLAWAGGRVRPAVSDRYAATGEATYERVRGIFSRIAGSYDTFNALASLGIDRFWRRALVKAAAFDADSRVLDIAAGTGDVSLAIAEHARPAEVVVSDFTPEMLEIARSKAKRLTGPTRLIFEQADAQDLPFQDGRFDVATVAFGVRNFPDRMRNYREVYRVLKPGGRYLVLEFSRPPFVLWRLVYHAYLRGVIPLVGGLLTGDYPSFVYLNDSIRRFPAQPELAAELQAAGFSAVTWRNMTGGIVALHIAQK